MKKLVLKALALFAVMVVAQALTYPTLVSWVSALYPDQARSAMMGYGIALAIAIRACVDYIIASANKLTMNVSSVPAPDTDSMATYRTQAIVGDGNVQSGGGIVSNYSGNGSVRMRVGDYMLKARNLSGVSVSADGPRMSLTIGGQTLTIEHKPRCPDPTCD